MKYRYVLKSINFLSVKFFAPLIVAVIGGVFVYNVIRTLSNLPSANPLQRDTSTNTISSFIKPKNSNSTKIEAVIKSSEKNIINHISDVKKPEGSEAKIAPSSQTTLSQEDAQKFDVEKNVQPITYKDDKGIENKDVLHYNWSDAQKKCPKGKHLMTKEEWDSIIEKCGGVHDRSESDDLETFNCLKSKGFNILFEGTSTSKGNSYISYGLGNTSYLWTSSEKNATEAYVIIFQTRGNNILITSSSINKKSGGSCLFTNAQ